MTDLADFLRARYTETREREQAKRMVVPSVVADLDAKLAIVDLMERTLQGAEGDSEVDHYGALGNADETLTLLARPFAGHPDYKEDWAA